MLMLPVVLSILDRFSGSWSSISYMRLVAGAGFRVMLGSFIESKRGLFTNFVGQELEAEIDDSV